MVSIFEQFPGIFLYFMMFEPFSSIFYLACFKMAVKMLTFLPKVVTVDFE